MEAWKFKADDMQPLSPEKFIVEPWSPAFLSPKPKSPEPLEILIFGYRFQWLCFGLIKGMVMKSLRCVCFQNVCDDRRKPSYTRYNSISKKTWSIIPPVPKFGKFVYRFAPSPIVMVPPERISMLNVFPVFLFRPSPVRTKYKSNNINE